MTTHYTVIGMTCAHCVASVTEEVSEINGVTAVAVDLPSGGLDVTGAGPIDREAVYAAVEEAGYRLAA